MIEPSCCSNFGRNHRLADAFSRVGKGARPADPGRERHHSLQREPHPQSRSLILGNVPFPKPCTSGKLATATPPKSEAKATRRLPLRTKYHWYPPVCCISEWRCDFHGACTASRHAPSKHSTLPVYSPGHSDCSPTQTLNYLAPGPKLEPLARRYRNLRHVQEHCRKPQDREMLQRHPPEPFRDHEAAPPADQT